jgi:hypothetical protein
MADLMAPIPESYLDQELGEGSGDLPDGIYEGAIQQVYLSQAEQQFESGADNFLLKDSNGMFCGELSTQANILLGNLEPIDVPDLDELHPNRTFMVRNLLLSIDETRWCDQIPEHFPWQLSATQNHLMRLAKALGLVERVVGGIVPVAHFDEFLRDTDMERASGLNGMRVRFKIKKRTFTKKDGTPGSAVEVKQYYPEPLNPAR